MIFYRMLLLSLLAFNSRISSAGDFYIYPIKEIQGINKGIVKDTKNLVDNNFITTFFSSETTDGKNAQIEIIDGLIKDVDALYPGSIIHPRQVYNSNVGATRYKFVNDESFACKGSPSFKVSDTFAIVMGISRASIFEIKKPGGLKLIQIPVTVNLQFVKPDLGKLVFSTYKTNTYTFSALQSDPDNGITVEIKTQIYSLIRKQVTDLLVEAKTGFNPKAVPIKLIDKDGKFFITDKGFESGFNKEDPQVEAKDSAGNDVIFNVHYADQGYAVLSLADGKATVGQSFSFIFAKQPNDSRKPRIMPLTEMTGEENNATVSEYFTKRLGYKASFQITPSDTNFESTKEMVRRQSNCVNWSSVNSMVETNDRKDLPNFLIKFSSVSSSPATLVEKYGKITNESFHQLVSAQIMDLNGKVIFSDTGDFAASNTKISGRGIDLSQASEVALKNASENLSDKVLNKAKFTPKEYPIRKFDKNKVWIDNIGGVTKSDKLSFDVLHPMSSKNVAGQQTLLSLDVSVSDGEIEMDGNLLGIPVSLNPSLPSPKSGDLLRLFTPVSAGKVNLGACAEPVFIASNNVVDLPYVSIIVEDAIYKSSKFNAFASDQTLSQINKTFIDKLFNFQVPTPKIDMCFQPGYVMREMNIQCANQTSCKSTLQLVLVSRFKVGNEVKKVSQTAVQDELSEVQQTDQKANIYSTKELSSMLKMQSALINSIISN